MSEGSIDILGGIFFIVIGLWFSLYYKQLGKRTAELWNMRFGLKGYQIGFLISGIAFVVFGFLSFIGIIKSK
jgi:hypothetical protein